MSEDSPVQVKICGLTRREDAQLAAESGADYLGTVLVPESKRAVTPAVAREIASGLGVPLVLVLANLSVQEMIDAARVAEASVLQLHGAETRQELLSLRDSGDWQVWKVLRVQGAHDVTEGFDAFAGAADALVLDTWHPERLGGTGVRFGWEDVAEVLGGALAERRADLAWVVAGGLVPENVGEAIRILSPDIVDVSSGVERRIGVKDPDRVQAFIRAAKPAGG